MRDVISKYSRKTKTTSSSTYPPMTLTAPKMSGDSKVTAIVAFSTFNLEKV